MPTALSSAGRPRTRVFACQREDGSLLPRPPVINHLPTQDQAGGDALEEMCHQDHCGDSTALSARPPPGPAAAGGGAPLTGLAEEVRVAQREGGGAVVPSVLAVELPRHELCLVRLQGDGHRGGSCHRPPPPPGGDGDAPAPPRPGGPVPHGPTWKTALVRMRSATRCSTWALRLPLLSMSPTSVGKTWGQGGGSAEGTGTTLSPCPWLELWAGTPSPSDNPHPSWWHLCATRPPPFQSLTATPRPPTVPGPPQGLTSVGLSCRSPTKVALKW